MKFGLRLNALEHGLYGIAALALAAAVLATGAAAS